MGFYDFITDWRTLLPTAAFCGLRLFRRYIVNNAKMTNIAMSNSRFYSYPVSSTEVDFHSLMLLRDSEKLKYVGILPKDIKTITAVDCIGITQFQIFLIRDFYYEYNGIAAADRFYLADRGSLLELQILLICWLMGWSIAAAI